MNAKIDTHRGHTIKHNATTCMIYRTGSKKLDKRLDVETRQSALETAQQWIDNKLDNRIRQRREPHIGTVDEYVEALNVINLGEHHHRMLMAHRNAPGRKLTATELSEAAGWDSGQSGANAHYGWLGSEIAHLAGLSLSVDRGDAMTSAIALWHEDTRQWQMHEEVAEAVDRLDIV